MTMTGCCRCPSTMRDQSIDSDDEVLQRDYNISTMASNLTREVFRYEMFDHEDADEVNETCMIVHPWVIYTCYLFIY